MKNFVTRLGIALVISTVAMFGGFEVGTRLASADTPPAVMLDAGAGSASTAPTTTSADQPASIADDYKALKASYDALKGSANQDAKKLLYAAVLAAALKFLLDGLKALSDKFNRGKKYIPWIATFAAIPIALLSHFAAGATWFDSLLYAGAGPGAVVFHELLALFVKPAAASS